MALNLTLNAVSNLKQLGIANDRAKVYSNLNLTVQVTSVAPAGGSDSVRYIVQVQDGSNATFRCMSDGALVQLIQQRKLVQGSVIRIPRCQGLHGGSKRGVHHRQR